jgi:ComF family protein
MNTIKTKKCYGIISDVIDIAHTQIQNIHFIEKIDIIVPVPSDPKRMQKRGFNQSNKIGQEIGKRFNTDVTNALQKAIHTEKQAAKSRNDRIKQKSDLFVLQKNQSKKLFNKNILLIDDVCSTGSTLTNCAKVLQKSNPKEINALTLFRGKKLGTTKKINPQV